MTGNLDELPGQLAELRELIRQVHAAIKDGRGLLKELRRERDGIIESARAAAQQAAVTEMRRFEKHIQGEMDRAARDLNRAVDAARHQVVRQLTVSSLEENPDGPGLRVTFAGNLFDDGSQP